jgi:hypothetical protein
VDVMGQKTSTKAVSQLFAKTKRLLTRCYRVQLKKKQKKHSNFEKI